MANSKHTREASARQSRSIATDRLSSKGAAPPALRLVAGASVLAALVVAGALLRYPHAMADDYSRAGRVKQFGPVGATVYEYRCWSGRWCGIGISCLLWSAADLSNPWNYRAALVALAAMSAMAMHFFLCAILELKFLAPRAIAWTLSLLAVYWAGMLAPGEGLCWLPAALEYQFGGAIVLFVMAGLIRAGRAGRKAKIAWMPAMIVSAALAPGMHELLGVVLCMVLGLGTLIALVKKVPSRWAWLAVAASACAGMAFVAAAPGNALRQASSPNAMDIAWALQWTGGRLLSFFSSWLGDSRLWAATFLFWFGADSAGLRPRWLELREIDWPFWIPLASLGIISTMFFVPAYATGAWAPYRAYNGTSLAFLIGWFLTVLAVRERLARSAGIGADEKPRGLHPRFSRALIIWAGLAGVAHVLWWNRVDMDGLPNLTQERVNVACVIFAVAFLAGGAAWVAMRGRFAGSPAMNWFRAAMFLTFSAAILTTGNMPLAWRDLTEKVALHPLAAQKSDNPFAAGFLRRLPFDNQGEPVPLHLAAIGTNIHLGPAWIDEKRTRLEWYDLQMGMRTRFIRRQAAAGRKQIMVAPILAGPGPGCRPPLPGGDWKSPLSQCWPATFFHSELSMDPGYWANSQLCPYFGIYSVALGDRFDADWATVDMPGKSR
jgi:hypothetical protein